MYTPRPPKKIIISFFLSNLSFGALKTSHVDVFVTKCTHPNHMLQKTVVK